MGFNAIIGQERPVRFLTRMLEKKCIPNALLFTGIEGIGKQKTAKAFGMALNCADPVGVSACEACASCQKSLAGSHPDMITVDPDGVFIKIDQVRALARKLRYAPLEGGWRVVIINNAQAMNLEASNAILKILEEPPKHTVMVLTATQTSELLPTIISRCHQIAFMPIACKKVAQVLVERKGLDQQTAMTLALCTRGSLGKACSTDAEKWTAWRTDLLRQVAGLSLTSVQPLFALAETLSRDKGRLPDGLDVMMTWFRDILMSRIAPARVINKDFMEEIKLASGGRPLGELMEKIEAVHTTQKMISQNVNARLALEIMLLRLCPVATSQKGM